MFLGSTLKIQEIVRMKDFFPLAKKSQPLMTQDVRKLRPVMGISKELFC